MTPLPESRSSSPLETPERSIYRRPSESFFSIPTETFAFFLSSFFISCASLVLKLIDSLYLDGK